MLAPMIKAIEARTHGRYLVQTPTTDGPSPLLVGFHGYGENAEHHLRELVQIPGSNTWLIVSVQALHRFYERSTGAIVGCWMTSQDRDQMIADNLAYVGTVVDTVRRDYATTATLVYSGFSQGVAMAYRAGTRGPGPAAGVMALAGDVPPELQLDSTLTWPRILIGRGTDDTYYTAEKMAADLAFLEKTAASFEAVVFDSGHLWDDHYRQAAGRFLLSCRSRPSLP